MPAHAGEPRRPYPAGRRLASGLQEGVSSDEWELDEHILYALRLDPDNVDGLTLATERARDKGQDSTALVHLEQFAKASPNDARPPPDWVSSTCS